MDGNPFICDTGEKESEKLEEVSCDQENKDQEDQAWQVINKALHHALDGVKDQFQQID